MQGASSDLPDIVSPRGRPVVTRGPSCGNRPPPRGRPCLLPGGHLAATGILAGGLFAARGPSCGSRPPPRGRPVCCQGAILRQPTSSLRAACLLPGGHLAATGSSRAACCCQGAILRQPTSSSRAACLLPGGHLAGAEMGSPKDPPGLKTGRHTACGVGPGLFSPGRLRAGVVTTDDQRQSASTTILR